MSLAVADLTVGLIVMPISSAYAITGDWRFGRAVCQFWLSVDYTASTASIFNLFILSLDRYWSITSPLRYLRRRTKKRALIMIALAWTGAAMWMIPVLGWHHFLYGGKRRQPDHVCETEFATNITFKVVTSILNFYIPTTCMIVLYVRIFLAIKRRSGDIDRLGASYVSNYQGQNQSKEHEQVNDSLTDHEGQAERKKERKQRRKQYQTSLSTVCQTDRDPALPNGPSLTIKDSNVQVVTALSNGTIQPAAMLTNGEREPGDTTKQWMEFQRLGVMATFTTTTPPSEHLELYEGVRVKVEYISEDGESDNGTETSASCSVDPDLSDEGDGSSNSSFSSSGESSSSMDIESETKETRSKDSLPVTSPGFKKVENPGDDTTSTSPQRRRRRRRRKKRRRKRKRFPNRPPTPRRPVSCQCQPSKSHISSSPSTQVLKVVGTPLGTGGGAVGGGDSQTLLNQFEANSRSSVNSQPVIPRRQTLALNHRNQQQNHPNPILDALTEPLLPTPLLSNHVLCYPSDPMTSNVTTETPPGNVTRCGMGNACLSPVTPTGNLASSNYSETKSQQRPLLSTETKSQQTIPQRRRLKPTRAKSPSNDDCEDEYYYDNNTSLGSSSEASNKVFQARDIVKAVPAVPVSDGGNAVTLDAVGTIKNLNCIRSETPTTKGKMTPNALLAFLKKPALKRPPNRLEGGTCDLSRRPKKHGTSPPKDSTQPGNTQKLSGKNSNNSGGNLNRANPKIILAKEKKAAKQLGVIVGAFILCWLPYFTLFMVVAYCGKEQCVNQTVFTTTTWLGYFNSALNPILYPLCNVNFKRAFKRMLRVPGSHTDLMGNNLAMHQKQRYNYQLNKRHSHSPNQDLLNNSPKDAYPQDRVQTVETVIRERQGCLFKPRKANTVAMINAKH
eukprot:TCALIF_01184-PA protein Name:"Similar to Hrh1 Histamine H1 receptor (Rattus norvegicus)" AED:0.43 eAED:0.43 QI:0/0/0/0.66/1/1/3/0/898